MSVSCCTPEEGTKEKSVEDNDEVEEQDTHNVFLPNHLVQEDQLLAEDDLLHEVKLQEEVGRVHSLPSECESGYDETPSECDLIVGDADTNLSITHDTEDEGRGSTRVGASSNLDFIDEGRDSVETEYAPDDSLEDKEPDVGSLSAVTELSSCVETETYKTNEENQTKIKDGKPDKQSNICKKKVNQSKNAGKSSTETESSDDSPRAPVGLTRGVVRKPNSGGGASRKPAPRHIPTTRSSELRASRAQRVNRNLESRFDPTSPVRSTTDSRGRALNNGITKSESLHNKLSSYSAGMRSRNSSPGSMPRASPRRAVSSCHGSPTPSSARRSSPTTTASGCLSSPTSSSSGGRCSRRRPGSSSSLTSPSRRSTPASPALLDRNERRQRSFGSPSLNHSVEKRGTGLVRSFRKENSPKRASVTSYSSLKRPTKVRGDQDRREEGLPRSSSISTISSFSSKSSGSRSKSFREQNQARLSEPEPFTCSRDCNQQWKQSDISRTSGGRCGSKEKICRSKPLQLWEIQQTLGRGDFIEGVLNVDFSNGLDSFIYAPIQLGRADGHFDRTSQHARRIQR